ncbi:capsular polysaccharide biosynthesis protein [Emticicia oligotrophica DSM 17448]|uniref:protein-tyrosine-phosphatase n=1 Tax=Emticicia oligotrophica (strain DSM 17448 / CIP 109782 / MTCC 6937 / GPTSA100-15) TaxID=929562 RepID=A0ABM5MZE7_EMTOG|nr:CpsB/CapC family capsule biosynthesis tyrosine phosphatase [Emticicia oligotrophica]AFK02555.1 capsular polysaccharide biosynthesis protein [Emticicia oligotrophica DSM 17448]
MFSFFEKKAKTTFGEMLKVDVHAHLIPRVANRNTDLETSIKYIKNLKSLGYQKIITTPNYINESYINSSDAIKRGLLELQKELYARNISISIEATAEYYLDTEFEKLLNSNDILSFGDKRYVLISMSHAVAPPNNFEEVIFNLHMKGYQPILSQPERYHFWHNSPRIYRRLNHIGCLMQVNILSLLGYYGRTTKKVALKLIDEKFVDFLGTNLYHDKHFQLLDNSAKNRELYDLIKRYHFKNLNLL